MKIFIFVVLAALVVFAMLPIWEVHGMTAARFTLMAFFVLLMILKVEYWYERRKPREGEQ